jgi:fibronectin type 3 domain-containing protein
VVEYALYRGVSSGGEKWLLDDTAGLSFSDSAVTNGQTYYYTVEAINTNSNSGVMSSEVSATPGVVPTSPQSVSCHGYTTFVDVFWYAPANDGTFPVTSYQIYRGTSSGGETILVNPTVAQVTYAGGEYLYADFSVTPGQTYYYEVAAVNAIGAGALSPEVYATPLTPPSAPQNFVAVGGDGQVSLSWSAPASGAATVVEYALYRGVSSGGEKWLLDDTAGLSFTDSAVTNGQTYYYTVEAINTNSNSGVMSSEVSATPGATTFTMIVSYSVNGGGIGYSNPTFNYYDQNNNLQHYSLTGNPTGIQVAIGTAWSVTPDKLTGSTNTERWYCNQALSGTASTSTIVFSYQTQYWVSYAASDNVLLVTVPSSEWVNSGGTATGLFPVNVIDSAKDTQCNFVSDNRPGSVSAPTVVTGTYQTQYLVSYAANAPVTVPANEWVVSGQSATGVFSSPVISGGTEYVFQSDNRPATITGPTTVTATYLTQYYLTVTSAYGTTTGAGWYSSGATAYAGLTSGTVSGGAGTQYVFTSWGSDASGTNYVQSNAITMSGPKTATAGWHTQYYLTVTSANGNPTGQGWYNAGASAPFSVTTPASGGTGIQYLLTSWTGSGSGGYSGSSSSSSVTMNNAITETANWQTQYQVTFTESGVGNSAGSNTVLKVGSTNYAYNTLPSNLWVNSGTTFSWTSTIAGSSGTQFILTGSSGLASPIAASGTDKATYQTQYYLTVTSAFGTTTGSAWYNAGSTATVSATAPLALVGEQYVWNGWTGTGTGSYTGSSNPATSKVIMNGPVTETASWIHQYYLTMSTNFGTVSPSSGWYAAGSAVTTSATAPSAGVGEQYTWNGWVGSGLGSYTGSSNPATSKVIMNGPVTETASWTHQYYLIITTNYGAVNPSTGWYTAGSKVSISATAPTTIPGERYIWQGWTAMGSGSYTGTSNSASVTMNGPIIELAMWNHQYQLTVQTKGIPSTSVANVYLGGTEVGTTNDASPFNTWINGGASTNMVGVDSQVSSGSSLRYAFTSWSDSSTANPRSSITMNAPLTLTANYKTQYKVTASYSTSDGSTPSANVVLSGTSLGAVSSITLKTTPQTVWLDAGTVWSVNSPIVASSGTTQWIATSGTSGTVSAAVTISPLYYHQFKVTLTQSGVGSDFAGTVATIDSTNYAASNLPATFWWTAGSTHTFQYLSSLAGTAHKYTLSSTTGTSSVGTTTNKNGVTSITVTGSGTITGNYAKT